MIVARSVVFLHIFGEQCSVIRPFNTTWYVTKAASDLVLCTMSVSTSASLVLVGWLWNTIAASRQEGIRIPFWQSVRLMQICCKYSLPPEHR